MSNVSVLCWIDSLMGNRVVTITGATAEEADQIFEYASTHLPDRIVHRQRAKGRTIANGDVVMHCYDVLGGDIELTSPTLSHEKLLDILPE